jgi:hypothetical protein
VARSHERKQSNTTAVVMSSQAIAAGTESLQFHADLASGKRSAFNAK